MFYTLLCILFLTFFIFRYENGGFESSFTPAQLQQIRKVTLAQVLCQTMENVDTLQPFVFLPSAEFGNERVPCDSFLFNNFDLSPWTEREFDFDNSINDFERTTNLHLPSTGQPNFTKQMTIDDLLADIFNTNKKTTPKKRPTVTQSSLQLDDKLDLPKQTKTPSKATSTSRPPKTRLTSNQFFPRQTVTEPTLQSTTVKINDKLDFSSKTLLNRNIAAHNHTDETNNIQSRRSLPDTDPDAISSHDLDKLLISVDNKNDSLNNGEALASKTYGPSLSEEFPFFSNLFNTIRPVRPIVKPQLTLYQQEYATTVKPPDKYTYLINIVPKTTTPRYDSQKETIKITIQGQQPYNRDPDIISYPFNKRPVYNQNKLEYRPIANSRPTNDRDEQYSTYAPDYLKPQHSSFRPQTTSQDRFDQNPDHHQRPSPYQPTYQSTTDYNPYGLVTFSHIETTKRPDLFNRPRPQYSTTDDEPTIVSADDGYGINQRPIRPPARPVPTGITIYIDNNKPRPKPQPTATNDNFNSNGGYSSISSDDENIPLFTRPGYQKPFSQKPESNFRPQYPKPIHFDNTGHDNVEDENSYNKPLQSDYGQFSSWSNRPDTSYSVKPDSDSNNDNTYSASHSRKPSLSNRNPSRRPDKPRPKPSVDISLASEYGTHHHSDISIVLKPNQNSYKSSVRTTPIPGYGSKTTTVKPVKHFYIGNILYKYPQSQDAVKHHLARTTNEGEEIIERGEIIKENYNNVWKPDKEEHEHFYGADDSSTKSNAEDANVEKSLNRTSNSKEHFDSNLPIAERKDDLETLPIKRRLFINAQEQNKGNNKHKNHVFFDVIPSENR